jgi:hypothetical protein
MSLCTVVTAPATAGGVARMGYAAVCSGRPGYGNPSKCSAPVIAVADTGLPT